MEVRQSRDDIVSIPSEVQFFTLANRVRRRAEFCWSTFESLQPSIMRTTRPNPTFCVVTPPPFDPATRFLVPRYLMRWLDHSIPKPTLYPSRLRHPSLVRPCWLNPSNPSSRALTRACICRRSAFALPMGLSLEQMLLGIYLWLGQSDLAVEHPTGAVCPNSVSTYRTTSFVWHASRRADCGVVFHPQASRQVWCMHIRCVREIQKALVDSECGLIIPTGTLVRVLS